MSVKSSATSTDLRARRTRKFLQDALLGLMAEKTFRDIQITEIADRAQVSRPAFYLHFRSKEELLVSHVDIVFDEFHEALSAEIARGIIDRRRFCVMLFEFWGRHAQTLKIVIQANIQSILLARVRDYLGSFTAELAARRATPSKYEDMAPLAVDFASGGAYMLLTHWIVADMPYSPEQMGQLLYDLSASCS